jgi:MarR family transcriptional regulator, organic hydroperoxide resistance regulator
MQRRTPDDLTDGLDFLIRDTRLRLYKHIEGRIAGAGIPLRFWFPLRALYRNEGITQRELGQILGFGDARAGVVVAAMQRKRLVARRSDRADKRKVTLFLTPEGKRMAQATLRAMRATQATLLAGFIPAEAAVVATLLARIRANLRDARV